MRYKPSIVRRFDAVRVQPQPYGWLGLHARYGWLWAMRPVQGEKPYHLKFLGRSSGPIVGQCSERKRFVVGDGTEPQRGWRFLEKLGWRQKKNARFC